MSNSRKNIQRSKPTVLNGVPNKYEGQNGDVIYRRVGRSVNQYVKEGNEWKKMASTDSLFDKEETSSKEAVKTLTVGLVNNQTEDFIKKNGSRDFTGNQSFGGNNITNVGTLDVDGATTLDQTSINTADGAFAVSGANPINLTTTGANKITLTSANDIDITPTGDLDIDANNVTVDTSRGYAGTHAGNVTVTGSADITTQATGSAANTVLVQNTNSHNSSFTGVHLKTDSGTNASNSACFNKILIECNNVATKSADYGVDIASSNQIRLRAGNTQPSVGSGVVTGMLLRATGNLQIGGGTDDITPDGSSPLRTIIDGVFETSSLYRPVGNAIVTDIGTNTNGSATGVHVDFQAIETSKLMRNFTYKAEGTVANSGYLEIVSSSNQDDTDGTVWLVTVNFKVNSQDGLNVGYCFKNGGQRHDPEDIGYLVQKFQDGSGGYSSIGQITLGPGSTQGIRWTNNSGAEATVKASAQRIQSGNDFS